MAIFKENKLNYLLLGLLFDGIGMISYVIPGVAETMDVIWAPIAGWLMTQMYKGNTGKVAGIFATIEELLPGVDIIPTFTLMWIYTYVVNGKQDEGEKTINVDS